MTVTTVEWNAMEPVLKAIRAAVFIREQGVPVELEWDGLDPACTHVAAWDEAGEVIATARMQPNGTIGRMAVLKGWRGRGVGSALLGSLLDLAAQRGLARVSLSAQTHAIGFYERAGFRLIGDLFLDAGIPHRKMERELEHTRNSRT